MNEENFLIQFIPSKHCFLQFSNKWFQKINNPKCTCLRLAHPVTKEELRFTWAPQPSYGLNDCSVGINATFAQALNLHENELVVISSEEKVTSLRQVFLTPFSVDDYEILETSQDNVEASLLNQIRVVYVKQIISVWVSKTVHLKLIVDCLEPQSSYGRLEQLTELVIENVSKATGVKTPKCSSSNINNISNSASFTKHSHQRHEPSFWCSLSNYIPNSVLDLLKPTECENDCRSNKIDQELDKSELLCRVHPFPNHKELFNCCNNAHVEDLHPFHVFVHKRVLQKINYWPKNTFVSTLVEGQSSVVLCRLESVTRRKSKSPSNKTNNDSNNQEVKNNDSKERISVIVRLYKIEQLCKYFTTNTNISCVYVSQFLRRSLDLTVGSKVRLTAFNPPLDKMLLEITLFPSKKLNEIEATAVSQQFSKRLSNREGVLINNDCPFLVPLTDGTNCTVFVQLTPEELDCWPLTQPELQVCPLVMATEAKECLESLIDYDEVHENIIQKTSVFKDLIGEGINTLNFALKLTDTQNQDLIMDNILITGKPGSGKSRLAAAICTAVSGPPHHVYVSVVDCKPFKGKKPESVSKIVSEILEECVYYQPAVLVLEDLPCIAGVPTNDLEPSPETAYFIRMATMLKELLWRVQVSHCMSVIATAESRTQIHPQLLSARGCHYFTTFLHIPTLQKINRLQILSELLDSKLSSSQHLNLNYLATKTEGCVAQDLRKLVDKVLFKACQHQIQTVDTELQVTMDDLDAAIQGFVPSGLINVSLVRHYSHTFASVGGLHMAKELLTEVLIWPTKYPDIFNQCPLRLERGILLYGAPGTGKTLLAKAVGGESGINFITVKGPELLSKYIGGSEEAVRNVFQKAQSAQPCIVFFDEFDSLAPRRGHDSTGVTDRVVNQLLTQMDGVEALEGVWVLAAASRPDLLDPALLRPGRIGTLVHCPLPDQLERLAILQNQSNNLQLTDDVNLDIIAAQTDGFTGADLQAILFTAQMTAYDALQEDTEDEINIAKSPVEHIPVSQADLLIALQDTKPSLKLEDRFNFQQIYERFQKSSGSSPPNVASETSQRITLA